MSLPSEQTLLSLATNIAQKGARATINALDTRQSLTEFSSYARMSPPVLMERSIARMDPENSQSISQFLLNLYIGHYLAVVSRVVRVDQVEVLEMLNPSSAASDRVRGMAMKGAATALGMESVDLLDDGIILGRVWDADNLDILADFEEASRQERIEIGMESNIDLSKPTSVAVGKIIEVPIDAEEKVKVPVTCTVLPRVLNQDMMYKTLQAFLERDNSYIGRYHRYMAGEFNNFLDYALGLDLIEQDLHLMVNDTDGQYEFAKMRSKRGVLSSFLSGKKQMNVASAMMVITQQTARQVEGIIRGPLARPRNRQRFFEVTGSMILLVVNQEEEMVTLYQRGIDDYGDYTFDQIKPVGSNPNAMDINSIMRAYKAGEQYSM